QPRALGRLHGARGQDLRLLGHGVGEEALRQAPHLRIGGAAQGVGLARADALDALEAGAHALLPDALPAVVGEGRLGADEDLPGFFRHRLTVYSCFILSRAFSTTFRWLITRLWNFPPSTRDGLCTISLSMVVDSPTIFSPETFMSLFIQ